MGNSRWKTALFAAACLLLLWIGAKYLLPVALPFLLGGLLALAAEPAVALCHRKLKLPRAVAAGAGVAVTLLLLAGLLTLLGAIAVKQLTRLADAVPDLESTAMQGLSSLRSWFSGLADRAPEGVQPVLHRAVDGVFSDGSMLVDRVASKLPGAVTAALSGVPNGALAVGTGLLAAFLISARLPKLKAAAVRAVPPSWREKGLPVLRRVRHSLGGWLRAQGILSAVIFGILCLGFLLLRLPNGFLWAFLITLMDAVPMLGTGIALVPWAAVSLLQGEQLRSIGLLAIFGCATLARSTLEPRLVGRQLGLDPLLTLAALYTGFRLWGFLGLLAAPILTAAVKSVLDARAMDN